MGEAGRLSKTIIEGKSCTEGKSQKKEEKEETHKTARKSTNYSSQGSRKLPASATVEKIVESESHRDGGGSSRT
jgi:hypothetical protein